MIMLNYPSKKVLREHIGKPLDYTETSLFGPEFKPNGQFSGCNRPSINKRKQADWREFFASVTMKNGIIHRVD